MSASPAPRWLLLLIAAVGVLAGAAAIAATTRSSSGHHSPAPASARHAPLIQGGTPPVPPLPRVAPALSALQTAQAFSGAYLEFLYGHRQAAGVPYASRTLRARLAGLHPQLPGAIAAAANPQLTSVHVTPTGPVAASATAVIEDGQAIDPITLTLTKHNGAWSVVDLTENG
jgi:hypothetical protein